MNMQRPRGITVLAVLTYVSAAWCLALGIVMQFPARARVGAFHALDPWGSREIPGLDEPGFRIVGAVLSLVGLVLLWKFGGGLWRLKDWARNLAIIFTVLDLLAGGPP